MTRGVEDDKVGVALERKLGRLFGRPRLLFLPLKLFAG